MSYDRGGAMLSYVGDYYKSSRIYNAQNAAKGIEIDTIRELIDELQLQLAPQTATWGINLWEELCGLPSITSETLETRREKVLSVLSVVTPMTERTLEGIILTSTGAIVDFADTEQPYVMRAIISEFRRRYDITPVKAILLNTAPAHLNFLIEANFTDGSLGENYEAVAIAESVWEAFFEDSGDLFIIGDSYDASAAMEFIFETFASIAEQDT